MYRVNAWHSRSGFVQTNDRGLAEKQGEAVKAENMEEKPNPGSDEALDEGCTCPVMDNRYGDGARVDPKTGKVMFWYTEGCPVHSVREVVAMEEAT